MYKKFKFVRSHQRNHTHFYDEKTNFLNKLNFYSFSTGGSSWEAGMISIDDAIVGSVHKTIHQLLKKF